MNKTTITAGTPPRLALRAISKRYASVVANEHIDLTVAAGEIHSDLAKGFIRAEVADWKDVLDAGDFAKAKKAGKVRLEGKEYVVKDGDVLLIRFNV